MQRDSTSDSSEKLLQRSKGGQYIYIYIYIHTHTHTYIYTHIYVYIYMILVKEGYIQSSMFNF